jgi:hypothetical protein
MKAEKPRLCAKCYLRIAPYESRTVYQKVDYHQNCFMRLVQEQAEEEKARRAFLRRARTESNQYVKVR